MRRYWMLAPLVVVLSQPAWGWNDLGHHVIALIAYRSLTPVARARVDAILAADPDHRDLLAASVWPDVERIHPTWHYVNIPYRPESGLGRMPGGESIVTALPDALHRLGAHSSDAKARADALCEVLHFVGDIHQPLHTVARFTPRTPEGDRGGNEVHLEGRWRNLHALWDNALNLDGKRPDANAEARALMREYPEASMRKLVRGNPAQWARESAKVAVDVAYTVDESAPPTPAYLAKVRRTAEERIALAGYRLAELLNRTLR